MPLDEEDGTVSPNLVAALGVDIEEEPNDDLDWEEWNPSRISFVNHMIAGSIAGLAEHISIFPVDTIKTYMQCEKCGSWNAFKTWNCVARMVHNEGPFRLWRGVSAMFAGCIPAHAAYFSIFEASKRIVGADVAEHQPLRAAVCGAVAAVSHDLIMTPFDVVKQRMQLGYYSSLLHCMRSIIRAEGVRALYISFPTTLMMNIPYGAVMVPVNESMKKFLNPTSKFNYQASIISGAVAGAVAAAVTTPLDVIKTRLQTQGLEPIVDCMYQKPTTDVRVDKSTSASSSVGAVRNLMTSATQIARSPEGLRVMVRRLLAEEGARAFMKGMVPRMLTQSPSVAISWTVYETVKNALQG